MIRLFRKRARSSDRPTASRALGFVAPLAHLPPERQSEQLARDYRHAFGSDRGARVLGDIMHRAGVFGAYPYGLPREERDRIDGQRELALAIAAAAGFELERMPQAAMNDDLRQASKGEHDERNTNGPDPDPDTATGDAASAVVLE